MLSPRIRCLRYTHMPYSDFVIPVLPWDNPAKTGAGLHCHMGADRAQNAACCTPTSQWERSNAVFCSTFSNSTFLFSSSFVTSNSRAWIISLGRLSSIPTDLTKEQLCPTFRLCYLIQPVSNICTFWLLAVMIKFMAYFLQIWLQSDSSPV